MAITLNDLVYRLEESLDDIEKNNYGNAAQRLTNIIGILNERGITIHATATIESKKVESYDNGQEEE